MMLIRSIAMCSTSWLPPLALSTNPFLLNSPRSDFGLMRRSSARRSFEVPRQQDQRRSLNGSHDFTLSFSSADKILPNSGGAANSSDANGSDPTGALSIFDAVSRQLGLKVEKTKRSYPVLVIDHMDETPTAN
jgi:hypothetical protein